MQGQAYRPGTGQVQTRRRPGADQCKDKVIDQAQARRRPMQGQAYRPDTGQAHKNK